MTLSAETLPPIQRPDGSIYRPRKVIAYPLDDENCDSMTSVVVFGTHDVGRAKALADRLVAEQFDSGYVSDGWSYGRRTFENDSEKGRAELARPCGPHTVVRRIVTDWQPVDGEQ